MAVSGPGLSAGAHWGEAEAPLATRFRRTTVALGVRLGPELHLWRPPPFSVWLSEVSGVFPGSMIQSRVKRKLRIQD